MRGGLETAPVLGRQLRHTRPLAQLQGPDVGDDRPAILGRDLGSEAGLGPLSVGDHVEEIARRRPPQPIGVVRGERAEPPHGDHAPSIAHSPVAERAEDVVALPPPLQHRAGDRKRELVGERALHLSSVKKIIRVQMPSRDGSIDQRTGGPSVLEEGALLEGVVAWFSGHLLRAGGGEEQAEAHGTRHGAREDSRSHVSTSKTAWGASLSRNLRVRSRSNRGSAASMQRKNLLRLASSKRGALKTGW